MTVNRARRMRERAGTAALVVVLAAGLAACSGGDGGGPSGVSPSGANPSGVNPSGAASRAASAAASLASQASDALASATAEAGRRLDGIKNGIDARDAVTLGAPATDADGRTTVAVTVANKADKAKSFAVQVNFKDAGGNLLDTVVVTVGDVPAGRTGKGTARSTHKLSGDVKPEVGTALRY
ncbi:FxLYD domain-containing protein [Streptomyces naganishii]|uniref:Lipoprotein n=1 Tax=Streptomyces naganishii JCM 4654 TaxID=1306179 RepID=A0A919CUY9_9ACTN|nr:FxLYD domain-containing protein [Streptomyces naganishii]GHD85427.1 hypothetical protein GCM10010508_09150 [Streptomyces naganishii JCM 4654]